MTITPGDLMSWEYGWGSLDCVVVRISAVMDGGACINNFGTIKVVVEAVEGRFITIDAAEAMNTAKHLLKSYLDVIKLSMTAGVIEPGKCFLVSSSDLEHPTASVLEQLKRTWKAAGNCPHCGYKGDWISLALCCKHHGVYI